MNPGSLDFRDELIGWTLRGGLCALTSFCWALAIGFNHPAEIAGMFVGVACWVVVFALLTACLPGTMLAGWIRFGRALKVAAWIKIGLTMLGLPASLGLWGTPLAMPLSLDMLLGIAALSLVSVIGGFNSIEEIARLNSVGWTALTTIVEGALMAGVIATLALLVLGWWRLRGVTGAKLEFPANHTPN